MPIFAYRCDACGFEKDVLQKRSDPPLSDCPECGQAAFRKQLAAPAFQLKGSGWYVTDFRDGKGAGKEAAKGGVADAAQAGAAPATPAAADGAKPAIPASEKAAAAPAAAAAPTATAPATTPTKTGT